MQQLTNVSFSREATFGYFLKPVLEQDSLFKGAVGTRRIVPFLGVNDGDPLATFVVPGAVIKKRATTAQIDAGTNAAFGNPTSSKATWALKQHEIHVNLHSQVVTDAVGLTNQDKLNGPDRGAAILQTLIGAYGAVIGMDLHRHAFWSDADLDFADYTDNSFEDDTITSLGENNGFLPIIKAALTAGDFSNYKTTNATGGIDVDGATLSTANAAILVKKLVSQAPRKLKMLNYGAPIEERPFGLLSHDLYERFKEYLAETYKYDSTAYTLFAYGTDGSIDLNSPQGLRYDGFAFYNAGNLFDDYWDLTETAGKDFKHMGLLTARENLAVGINLKNPNDIETGLTLYRHPDPSKQGLTSLHLFLQTDFLIGDTTLMSGVGLEQIP